jgi:sulfur carrier protein ThiS
MVEIYLGGHLNFYQADKRTRLFVAVDRSIGLLALLKQIGIPVAEVAFATLNGELAELPSTEVSPGDRVELYPPMGGG